MENLQSPYFILLLGSYDPDTNSLLKEVKESLEEAFTSNPKQVSVIILDETEIYNFALGERSFSILVEKYEGGVTLTEYDPSHVINAKDFHTDKENLDSLISQYLSERHKTKFYTKLSLLEKLNELSRISSAVFLIRDQELTRGGEYIELGFLLLSRLDPSKIQFFKKEGMNLSEMAWEILDAHKINSHPYGNREFLLREVVRVTRRAIAGP